MFIEDFKIVRHYCGLLTLKTQGNCFGNCLTEPHGLSSFLHVASKEQIFGKFPNC